MSDWTVRPGVTLCLGAAQAGSPLLISRRRRCKPTLHSNNLFAARDSDDGRLSLPVPSFESALLKKQNRRLDRALTLSFALTSLGALGLMLALGPFLFWTDSARVEPRSVLVACLLVFSVFFLGTCLAVYRHLLSIDGCSLFPSPHPPR